MIIYQDFLAASFFIAAVFVSFIGDNVNEMALKSPKGEFSGFISQVDRQPKFDKTTFHFKNHKPILFLNDFQHVKTPSHKDSLHIKYFSTTRGAWAFEYHVNEKEIFNLSSYISSVKKDSAAGKALAVCFVLAGFISIYFWCYVDRRKKFENQKSYLVKEWNKYY